MKPAAQSAEVEAGAVWLAKSLAMRFGDSDTVARLRSFKIGLIFGNLSAITFWAILALLKGRTILYWPA